MQPRSRGIAAVAAASAATGPDGPCIQVRHAHLCQVPTADKIVLNFPVSCSGCCCCGMLGVQDQGLRGNLWSREELMAKYGMQEGHQQEDEDDDDGRLQGGCLHGGRARVGGSLLELPGGGGTMATDDVLC